MERLANIHPGEILQKDFLEPYGLTAYRLAKDLGIDQTRVSQIIKGKRAISADTRTAKKKSKRFTHLQSQIRMDVPGEGEMNSNHEMIERPHHIYMLMPN